MTQLSPLDAIHREAGAKMTSFAGWSMPLRYGSELSEHEAVRTRAGMFDLSHMGQLTVSGEGAATALDAALSGEIAPMAVGRAKYTLMCAPDGGVIDDLIVYRLAGDEFLVIANAANRQAVTAELIARGQGAGARVRDCTTSRAMIALQGPRAAAILTTQLTADDEASLAALKYYRCVPITLPSGPALLARTGYTGEDGFELMTAADAAPDLWRALAAAGESAGMVPCGLAARDTLRLEAAMPLYGHELDATHNPYQAGLGRAVALGKDSFTGKDALAQAASEPPGQVLAGLRGEGRRAPRQGYQVRAGGAVIGQVTSGALSPTLGYPIALAYLDAAHAAIGTELDVDLRGTPARVTVCETPFYRRPR